MDFFKGLQSKIENQTAQLWKLSYEKNQLKEDLEKIVARIEDIDLATSHLEGSILAYQQAQKEFNHYVAEKEHAMTLEDVKTSIENGGK